MRRIVLTLALAAVPLGLFPAQAHAQFGALYQQRAAERQVASWFQAYLGRLPTSQELALLTNQNLLSGNALYVQSIILASNESYLKSGGTPQGFLNRLFVLTLGRQPTLNELAGLRNQVLFNGRLWFVQNYLSQISGGRWALNNWNVTAVPYPVVVPIIIR